MAAAKTLSPLRTETIETRETKPQRYLALDAYRGFIMICLAASGFGFAKLAEHPFWGVIGRQVDHVQWEGLVFWDLIQPAFMFMVGVAMPFSFGNRLAAGSNFSTNLLHTVRRCLILVALSNLFTVAHSNKIEFGLINVLSQIALCYLPCFLMMQLPIRAQVIACAAILALHTGLFHAFPGPLGPFSKEGNIGQVVDQWLLGRNYSGYYVTINFLGSIGTTMFGVWCGYLLRSDRSTSDKTRWLAYASAAGFASGLALSLVNPMVKRIWTLSFTLYSAGWVILMLLAFFWLVEMRGHRKFVFPLVVVGMNSIFAYCMGQFLRGSIHRMLGVLGGGFDWVGTLAPVVHATATAAVIWYFCYWLYQRKAFVKV